MMDFRSAVFSTLGTKRASEVNKTLSAIPDIYFEFGRALAALGDGTMTPRAASTEQRRHLAHGNGATRSGNDDGKTNVVLMSTVLAATA